MRGNLSTMQGPQVPVMAIGATKTQQEWREKHSKLAAKVLVFPGENATWN